MSLSCDVCPTRAIAGALLLCAWSAAIPAVQPDPATINWVGVVARNKPATVLIRVETPSGVSFGSGVLITRAGHVITAAHILPSKAVRQSGSMLVTSLIGWDSPSLDLSLAVPMDVHSVSEDLDLALLTLKEVPPNSRPVFFADSLISGEPLLVMGYPNGGALRSTAGIASGAAANNRYTTDAAVGKGNSGGPVFNIRGGLVGILLEGTKRNADAQIQLGFFARASGILKYAGEARVRDEMLRTDTATMDALPSEMRIAYGVSEMKDDHPVVFAPHSRDYSKRFLAQDGYQIVDAQFEADSANHVTRGPTRSIEPGGGAVVVSFTIESGPSVDRWRGWLSGNVVTRQRRLPELRK